MHNGNVASNGFIKLLGYAFFPGLIIFFLYSAISLEEVSSLCLVGIFAFFEMFYLLSAISISKQGKNRDLDEKVFQSHMRNLGYHELPVSQFTVRFTGRYGNEPVSVRVNGGNHALVDLDESNAPDRYGFYSVGEGDHYLLVDDGLQETLRLFSK